MRHRCHPQPLMLPLPRMMMWWMKKMWLRLVLRPPDHLRRLVWLVRTWVMMLTMVLMMMQLSRPPVLMVCVVCLLLLQPLLHQCRPLRAWRSSRRSW